MLNIFMYYTPPIILLPSAESPIILLPSAESHKKGCCQLQVKVCARITG